MIWLIGLVLVVQGLFYWVLKPAISFTTPLFEAQSLFIVIIVVLAWLFSGKSQDETF